MSVAHTKKVISLNKLLQAKELKHNKGPKVPSLIVNSQYNIKPKNVQSQWLIARKVPTQQPLGKTITLKLSHFSPQFLIPSIFLQHEC